MPKIRDPQTHAIIGAAMEVHRQLGPGFLEAIYQGALGFELADPIVPNVPQRELPVFYKGRRLNCFYKADFVCFDAVIVEIKALKALTNTEIAQVLNYLKATGLERALLLNFGGPSLQFKRLILSKSSGAIEEVE